MAGEVYELDDLTQFLKFIQKEWMLHYLLQTKT